MATKAELKQAMLADLVGPDHGILLHAEWLKERLLAWKTHYPDRMTLQFRQMIEDLGALEFAISGPGGMEDTIAWEVDDM